MIRYLFLSACFFSLLAYGGEFEDATAAYDQKDFAKAMELFLPLAEAGNGDALGNIGNMYGFGWGVPTDYEKAMYYWEKAADKHVPKPMGNIAACYMTGKCGFPKDVNRAAEWYRKASEHGHVPSMMTFSAMYDLGLGMEKNKGLALAWAAIALTNAADENTKNMASIQFNQAKRGATAEDMADAKKRSDELIALISKNVALYKTGK